MGLSEETEEENIEQRFDELCLDLNLDKNSRDEAWQSYGRIRQNYSLEGDTLHWLACALYVACRKSMPTVGRGEVEGNCVSLTRMLRSAKLSLINFFNKMKKWVDMAHLPQDFRDKVDRLERNFAVSTVIFKKFEPIFLDIFKNPAEDPPRQARSRKQRRLPCTVSEVFNFCWTMFVQVKGNYSAISDDLVNSYHVLLCCVDWFYANALISNRKDLLSPKFSDLPEGFANPSFKPPTEVPCIISQLCEKHGGIVIEAKCIKEHWWKPFIKKLVDKKRVVLVLQVLKGRADNLMGILDIGTFESNSKAINQMYETYVLSVGDFDERIFLGEEADAEIGTPAKTPATAANEFQERMMVKKKMQAQFEPRSLAPSTPLTGRRYLKEKEPPITPISTATQGVSRLQALLSGRKTCPSDTLLEIFSHCTRNPKDDICERVKQMGEKFCTMYAQPSEDHPGSHIDFAKKRLQLAESLYFKTLENIMVNERRRLVAKDKNEFDFSYLLEHDTFHRSLFACCLEIVIFSYNSQRTFPWVIDIYDLQVYNFYKVIEILIRAEDGLSRDVVKHLNHIEETILESLAWKSESPLWEAIRTNGPLPTCEEVSLPHQIEKDGGSSTTAQTQIIGSPAPVHPALKRIVGARGMPGDRRDLLQSPTGPSAADRFSSPAPGSARRQLFTSVPSSPTNSQQSTSDSTSSENSTPASAPQPTSSIVYQQLQTEDGKQVLVPLKIVCQPSSPAASSRSVNSEPQLPNGTVATTTTTTTTGTKPKKTGSLALFFRKMYHLVSVRLRHLCEQLGVDNELRSQIWTCLEHTIVHFVDLMQDRHIDQLLMCAVYVMCKVTRKDRSFQDIMRCYRVQPQAQSHVYRSVLLTSRKRRTSGSSDSSKNGASGSNSPTTVKEEETKEHAEVKRRNERLALIRSTSTLPVPNPNSQPPTPTRLIGIGSSFEFEDRGDLIEFYNSVYVKSLKNFALKFSTNNQERGVNVPPLSPLPAVRPHTTSPRRISNKHSVYISPHKSRTLSSLTPHTKLLYCFNRSPAKDLLAINKMMSCQGEPKMNAVKRIYVGEESGQSPSKRRCPDQNPVILKRFGEMMVDRKASGNV